MNDPPKAKILVLATDPQWARQWADLLGEAVDCVAYEPTQVADFTRPDVILTNLDATDPQYLAAIAFFQRAGLGVVEPGLVRIGGSGPADVELPPDATGREIRLACQMTAEVARLRGLVRQGIEIHRQLFEQALTDPLTGLPNRRACAEELCGPWCIAVFDLDHFKQVNDHYGHAAGDAVLREVGRLLPESLRQGDLMARLGGDEFVVAFRSPGHAASAPIVDRVRRSLVIRPAIAADCVVTASAGFHVVPASSAPLPCPAELLARADAALRRAKQSGRDCARGTLTAF
jgi:diguanylate cyclase (GGDEF)-like protein